jgi:hypothetical protein
MQQAITCSKCGSPNALGQRFCWNCGTTMASSCPNCGAPMDIGSRFCGNCGAQLPPQQQGGWQTPPPPQQQGGWNQPQQQPGWGQPPPQQPGWGQPPPPQQQQPGWGPPPPQQPGWGQHPPPQQQQPGWGVPPPQQPGWGQPPRQKGVGGLVALLIVLVVFLCGFAYWQFFMPGKATTGSGSTSTSAITEGPFFMVKNIDNAANKVAIEITWKTNGAYKGQVEYGTDTTYGSTTQLDSDFAESHTAPLPDLKMSTSYNYRVILKNKDNKEWKSSNYTATTPKP